MKCLFLRKSELKPGIVAQACDLTTQETEEGRTQGEDQPSQS
jgi:hypothetical protein